MSQTVASAKKQYGEKPFGRVLHFLSFLETHPTLTYRIRMLTEHHFQVKKEAVAQYLDPKGRILDIACGDTFLRPVIASSRYVGADRAANVLKRGQQLYHQSPGVLIATDVLAMGFKDEIFENCVALDVFHHIRDADVETMLLEIKRVLKDGGHFLVTDPIKVSFLERPVSKLLQWLDRGDCFRNIPELSALLSRHFKIEHHKIARTGISRWQVYHLRKV